MNKQSVLEFYEVVITNLISGACKVDTETVNSEVKDSIENMITMKSLDEAITEEEVYSMVNNICLKLGVENIYIENHQETTALKRIDLQYFATPVTETISPFENLMSKFSKVEIKNDTRITEADKTYCENQERMYKEAIEAMEKTLELFKSILSSYEKDEFNRHVGFINQFSDIYHIEDRMKKIKNEFISILFRYFERTYNVTLRNEKAYDKYDFSVTYQNIVDEVFEQLGGFNFNEKAVNEIKAASRDTIYNDSKITIKKGKLSIQDFVWWDHTWNDKKRIGYGDRKLHPLFKALSHFETGDTEMLYTFDDIYTELNQGEEKYNIFNKYVGYRKVNSIKFFKNGKIEIEFQSMQQAEEFKREYLTK